jgi:hypothetical protein
MSKHRKTRLKGPWGSVQTAIWLIGLAILALNNWWWPGILVLVAISTLSQAAIQAIAPDAVEELPADEAPAEAAPQPVPTAPKPIQVEHPTGRLPSECPKCSAPVRGSEVQWTGPQSADCPYCGANLPLKSG